VDVPIQAGSDLVLDILGLHMNRKLFKFSYWFCLTYLFPF
jgi:hypothetical protein